MLKQTDHDSINQKIRSRALHPGYDDNTYYNQALYDFACDNQDDPLLLFKIKIYGYYARIYKWTSTEADWFIAHNAVDAVGHDDGSQLYLYDWGKGNNQITNHMMHEPNLDHIDPRSLSNDNTPHNFRIRCARLNENKGNMVSDKERRATVLDMMKDMEQANRDDLIQYINQLYGSK
jgi:hypothetical protein